MPGSVGIVKVFVYDCQVVLVKLTFSSDLEVVAS